MAWTSPRARPPSARPSASLVALALAAAAVATATSADDAGAAVAPSPSPWPRGGGAVGVVAGAARRGRDDAAGTPSWEWRRADTSEVLRCVALGGACGTVAGLLLVFAGVATHKAWRLRAGAGGGAAAEDGPGTSTGARSQAELFYDTEGAPTAADAAAAAMPAPGRNVVRAAALVCIGLSPLVSCVVLGESFRSVLIAMVFMHWGAMTLLPSLYYAVQAGYWGHGYAAYRFYAETLRRLQHEAEAKTLRGSVMGIPVLIVFFVGYIAFRCKTYTWALCINNFTTPMEKYGFQPHSMPFRLLTAAYFTFWNPVAEEFFWRVFLHHELGEAMGVEKDEEERLVPKDDESSPWRSLGSAALHALPGRAPLLRWGVSAMYASYHIWPIKVVFQRVWWAYAGLGFGGLLCLGRFFLLLREHPRFGLPAAYVLHVWVDAAFSLLALFKVHPYELGEEP